MEICDDVQGLAYTCYFHICKANTKFIFKSTHVRFPLYLLVSFSSLKLINNIHRCRCVITGNGSASYMYLGRPWGPFGRVVFAYTWMDACIKPVGWHNWGKTGNERTACFYEYRYCSKHIPFGVFFYMLCSEMHFLFTVDKQLCGNIKVVVQKFCSSLTKYNLTSEMPYVDIVL